jgi:hypothetical protein
MPTFLSSLTRRVSRRLLLDLTTLAGPVLFALIVATESVFARMDPTRHLVSEYARHAQWAPWQNAAFWALAASVCVLGLRVWHSRISRSGGALLAISAMCIGLMEVYPVSQHVQNRQLYDGSMHDSLFYAVLVLTICAMALLRRAAPASLRRVTDSLLLIGSGSLAMAAISPAAYLGLIERVVIGVLVLWLCSVCMHLRRTAAAL